MRATVMYSAGDVRIESVPDPQIIDPTDAVMRVTRACVCGSDLWPYQKMEHSDTVRVLRRHMRVLPRRASNLLHPWRIFRHIRGRWSTGRSGTDSFGGWDPVS